MGAMGDRAAKDALFDAFAEVAKALASGRRAEIADLLAQGERPVEEVAAEIGQSVANTSHHLRAMARAGIVATRRDGTRIFYRLAGDRVGELWAALRDVAAEHVAGLERLAGAYLGERDGIEVLGRAELAARLKRGEVVVLDVRPSAEYESGHIRGARSTPIAELRRHLRALPPGVEVVAYCRGPYCVYADEAVRELNRQGFRARRLIDGFPEWKRAGLPVAAPAGRREELAVAGPLVVPVVDEGLGNSAYLADLGDGRALAVDVPRDLRAVRAAADRHELKIAFGADTHLHADFLSGAVQLAADDGAQILASASGGRAFGHRGLADGDEVDLGGLTLRAWVTPGHTAEHLVYLLLDGGQVLGVFTGGSLLVGGAARTDLSGPEHTESLARAQYASLSRLLTLPDATPVYPTHGAGSFCSAPPGAERTTTIGREKAANPLLAVPDEDAFVKALLASLGTFPGYFLRLPEDNRRGPAVLASTPALAPLTAGRVRAIRDEGGQVVDVRPVADYAAGHIPGSLAIPLRGAFATWLGWLVPDPATPLVIVAGPGQDLSEVIWQALKIGYENLAGTLAGGVPALEAAGSPAAVTPLLTPGQVDPAAIIDVRQASEYAAGHLPGARNVELGVLTSQAASVGGRPVVTMCGHSERAATAASLLERAGHTAVAVLAGGPPDWSDATGVALETNA